MGLNNGKFESWKYESVIKPLSALGTGTNGTGTFFSGALADLLEQPEHAQNPDAVIATLEAIFARRATDHPEDAKSPAEAADFIKGVRASLAQAIAKQ